MIPMIRKPIEPSMRWFKRTKMTIVEIIKTDQNLLAKVRKDDPIFTLTL
jgi:hypothetical protein